MGDFLTTGMSLHRTIARAQGARKGICGQRLWLAQAFPRVFKKKAPGRESRDLDRPLRESTWKLPALLWIHCMSASCWALVRSDGVVASLLLFVLDFWKIWSPHYIRHFGALKKNNLETCLTLPTGLEAEQFLCQERQIWQCSLYPATESPSLNSSVLGLLLVGAMGVRSPGAPQVSLMEVAAVGQAWPPTTRGAGNQVTTWLGHAMSL